jgi:hypothetical protein
MLHLILVSLQLLDELLKEEHVMGVIGCLEYDPDLQTPQQHRTFLQTAVVFKEVVPITSQVRQHLESEVVVFLSSSLCPKYSNVRIQSSWGC